MKDLAAPETAAAISRSLSGLGFRFTALDLAGYRMGSMNDLPADR
jgi:PP-loop superfamily ATP-utilizing enzyme